MAALFRRARATLTYAVVGSIDGGRRVPHAPAPTRYRFAVQGAENKAILLRTNASLDAQWSASAWASLATGAGGSGAGGDDVSKALWDMRLSAHRLEKHASRHSSELQTVAGLVKARLPPPPPPRKKLYTDVLIVIAAYVASAVSAICYEELKESATLANLQQLSVDFLNNVATDPQTKETMRMYLVMFTDVVKGSLNPLGSGVEGQKFSTQVDEECRLAEKILLVLHLHNGPTVNELYWSLNSVRSEDHMAISKSLLFLMKSGFVVAMPMPAGRKATLWPSKATIQDLGSGKLPIKLKTKIEANLKAELKAKAEGGENTQQS